VTFTINQFRRVFPKALRAARQEYELSQTDLAKLTDMSQDWISHFEGGRRVPGAYALIRLQLALPSLLQKLTFDMR
jgi:transcriptional regulator with XRE-family HTH domain